jgi:hypothetical protein
VTYADKESMVAFSISCDTFLEMKTEYILTFFWPSTPSISVRKEFEGKDEREILEKARSWRLLCLDICGKNEFGEMPIQTPLYQV